MQEKVGKEKVSILVRCRNDFSNVVLDRLVNQTYQNTELIFFAKNSSDIKNEFVVYDEDNFTADFIKNNINGEYIIIFNENEYFLENNSLELMYEEMQSFDSNLSISSSVILKNGIFKFIFAGEQRKTNLITKNNIWLYTRRYFEFRKISGVLFKKELLEELEDTEQETLNKLILAARNPIFDCRSHCVFKENEYSMKNYSWNMQPIPNFISLSKVDSTEIIEDKMSIALCVNTNYCKYLSTIIYSIEKNCSKNVDVYILYYDVDTKILERIYLLNRVLEKVNIILKKMPTHHYNDLEKINRTGSKLPIEAYFRLLLPILLPNLQRILYLDIDMLVVGDLYNLWHTTFDGNFMIATPDYPMIQNQQSWGYQFLDKELGKRYINSGMLLMNLKQFRQYDIYHRFLSFVKDTSEFYILDDQDAYNLYFNGYIKLSDMCNNFVLSSLMYKAFDINKLNIIHYCGYSIPKPWDSQPNLPLNQFHMVQKYRLYKREIEAKLHPTLKVAVFLTLHSIFDIAIQQIESLDIQVGSNMEIFVFCQNNDTLEKLANRYSFSPTYTAIHDDINNKYIVDILNCSNCEYAYFLFEGNRLDNVETLSVLTQMASDNHASLLASPAKTSNDDPISFVDAEKNLINLDKMSYQDVLDCQGDVFQQVQGVLFKRDVLLTYVNSGIEMNYLMKKIYENEKNKFYLKMPLWIRLQD